MTHVLVFGNYPQIVPGSVKTSSGGGEGNRTPGPLHAKQVLSR